MYRLQAFHAANTKFQEDLITHTQSTGNTDSKNLNLTSKRQRHSLNVSLQIISNEMMHPAQKQLVTKVHYS